ncbi:hypothetical protein [Amycolatopsis eburnea]|uniref:Secreted protein n=1 Tax=Amycolatopsis eburnea TaxID=2267691 RepID=A0A427THH3_9PSEU|nr:hypothetical protein [Amycolatopsis eburnea]RSD22830.1 hypothetical protein EIY87_06645 [Amycolatopsis eburnea]
MKRSMFGVAVLVGGLTVLVPSPASAASIPPDCKVWSDPRWGVGYSQCSARAHRVAVYCDWAAFPLMGPWRNKNEISERQCDIGESPTRVSVDFPD